MNPYVIIGFLLAMFAAGAGGYARGGHDADVRWKGKIDKERADASEQARTTESMWQGVVNGTAKNYQKDIAAVRSNLDIALDSLRDRPERAAGVSEAPRADCAGANGAELSGAHARFLARFAALAADSDAGLKGCYAVIDGTR